MHHYTKKGEPLSCPRCSSTMLGQEIKATDGGHTSEFAVRCGACNAVVGYWAYGSWDPETVAHWEQYARKRNPPKTLRHALADLGRALRSLGRAILRNARGRL